MSAIHRLMFNSRASAVGDEAVVQSITTILSDSVRRNRSEDVTSALTLQNGRFFQVLEGSRATIDAAYDRIRLDLRHYEVVFVLREDADHRLFPRCPMVLVGFSSPGRRTVDALAAQSSGSLVLTDPHALMGTMHAIAAVELVLAREPARRAVM